MAVFTPAKRAMARLGTAARARLTSYHSSGNEHDAPPSELVSAFLESECCVCSGAMRPNSAASPSDSTSNGEDLTDQGNSAGFRVSDAVEEMRELLDCAGEGDTFWRGLASDVSQAVGDIAALRPTRPEFRRAVMSRLRDCGYNAGICKTRWDGTHRVAAGYYEYIDVIVAADSEGHGEERYIVDVGFAGEFEVARPTEDYMEVLAALPDVVVARSEDVRRLVRVAGKAARRSLKCRGLSVPPWRKKQFMAAKWFGPYCRSTNAVPAAFGPVQAGEAARCRTMGFLPAPTVSTATSERFTEAEELVA